MARIPCTHTEKTDVTIAVDTLIAMLPILIWGVYMFGARVITICLICVISAAVCDFLLRKLVFRLDLKRCVSPYIFPSALLCALMMPVSAPFWIPALGGLFVTGIRALRLFGGRTLFCPPVFAAAVMNLCFPAVMTAFTRPFAYFNAFTPVLPQKLVDGYRLSTPLQMYFRETLYEGGETEQIVGFSAGNIGEIAVCAILFGFLWLVIRRAIDWKSSAAYIAVIFVLVLAFPPDDSMAGNFAIAAVICGAVPLLSVFALADNGSVPTIGTAKIVFSVTAGALTVLFRRIMGAEGAYYAILCANILSPLLDRAFKKSFKAKVKTEQIEVL